MSGKSAKSILRLFSSVSVGLLFTILSFKQCLNTFISEYLFYLTPRTPMHFLSNQALAAEMVAKAWFDK